MLEMDGATEFEAMESKRSTLEDVASETGVTILIDRDIVEKTSLLIGAELEDALDPTTELSENVEEAASCAEFDARTLIMLKLLSLGKGESSIDRELLLATLLSGTTTELPGTLPELGTIGSETTADDVVGLLCKRLAVSESLKPALDNDKVARVKDIVETCDNMASSGGPMSQFMKGILDALDSSDKDGVPWNGSPITDPVDGVEEALEVDMAGELPSGRPMYQSLESELNSSGYFEVEVGSGD